MVATETMLRKTVGITVRKVKRKSCLDEIGMHDGHATDGLVHIRKIGNAMFEGVEEAGAPNRTEH